MYVVKVVYLGRCTKVAFGEVYEGGIWVGVQKVAFGEVLGVLKKVAFG